MKRILAVLALFIIAEAGYGQQKEPLEAIDFFELEWVSSPEIAPNGTKIVYLRNFMDVMEDQKYSNLWIMNADGSNNRPLNSGSHHDSSPNWSPDGKLLIYKSDASGKTQIVKRWMDQSGSSMVLSSFAKSPSRLSWSPDQKWLAFTMAVRVDGHKSPLPSAPKGAKWNDAPQYVDKVTYRNDGRGYVQDEYTQIFIISTTGGAPIQLTRGDWNHNSDLAWSKDGKSIFFSGNDADDRDLKPREKQIYKLDVSSGALSQITNGNGPESVVAVSPDGKKILYTGFTDEMLGFQTDDIYTCNLDGSGIKKITGNLDRSAGSPFWSADGKQIFFSYHDKGNSKVASVSSNGGKVKILAKDLGGLSLGRPYSGGAFSVSDQGAIAMTYSRPSFPAELAIIDKNGMRQLTDLNADFRMNKQLGEVEELWTKSSFDQLDVQGWICKPPNFDPNKKYPLILEIHGGPFTNYGDRFSAEVQMLAAKGYVVLYMNPRGSTSYGAAFANEIHHNYPNNDYDDLMSGVDAVIEKGYIDTDRLYVTGGSGGGVLTAWIIGHTDRFAAAVVAKPVINWYSFVLTADGGVNFYQYWFPGLPWENLEHYMKRSPISYVGNVTTPTMLLTGDSDFRTPISETEQYYAALKYQNVPAAMVRIKGAGHGIANRPSNLIAKVSYILSWFEKYQ